MAAGMVRKTQRRVPRRGLRSPCHYPEMSLSLGDDLLLETDEAVCLLLAYPSQTVAVYDRGPSSGHDKVGPAEIGRLIVIEPLSQGVATALVRAAETAPWQLVPEDARLADADPESDLYWQAAELYRHFDNEHGVGDAIASKLLHLKRPAFFPILDRLVCRFYDGPARRHYDLSARGKRELPRADRLYWAAIREDLVSDTNRSGLEELRAKLSDGGESRGRQIATLPAVRLLDMLLWQHLKQKAA